MRTIAVFTMLVAMSSGAVAQVHMPVRPELQTKAQRLAVAYYEQEIIAACKQLVPGIETSLNTTDVPLQKVIAGLEPAFTGKEIADVKKDAHALFEKFRFVLMSNPNHQCAGAVPVFFRQVQTGFFNESK